jgi:hypothetical protein
MEHSVLYRVSRARESLLLGAGAESHLRGYAALHVHD